MHKDYKGISHILYKIVSDRVNHVTPQGISASKKYPLQPRSQLGLTALAWCSCRLSGPVLVWASVGLVSSSWSKFSWMGELERELEKSAVGCAASRSSPNQGVGIESTSAEAPAGIPAPEMVDPGGCPCNRDPCGMWAPGGTKPPILKGGWGMTPGAATGIPWRYMPLLYMG